MCVTDLRKWENMVTCLEHVPKTFGAEPKSNNDNGAERPKWVDYADFEEDVHDISDSGFKDETIGHWECFRQLRNRRDFMYFDEVLWQKKMRIQKERWYQREKNKEISVLKNETKSLSRILEEMKQELEEEKNKEIYVNGNNQCLASFRKRGETTLQ